MLTAHELIGFMAAPRALEILEYAYQSDKELYKATLSAVAQARKVRPVFLQRQPRKARHESMLATLSKPALELAAGTLIRAWLLKQHKQLLVDFLEALGIAHQDGVVDELPESMDDTKLRTAIEAALSRHPHEVVAIYLHAFYEMNEARWSNLKTLLDTDTRLQLGG